MLGTKEDKEDNDKDIHRLSCCQKLVALENICCGFGNLWGILSNPRHIVVWWMIRHGAIYAPVVILLLLYVPESMVYVIAFFFFAHLYKLGRYFLYSIQEIKEKKKKLKNKKMGTTEDNKNESDGSESTIKEIAGRQNDSFDINV